LDLVCVVFFILSSVVSLSWFDARVYVRDGDGAFLVFLQEVVGKLQRLFLPRGGARPRQQEVTRVASPSSFSAAVDPSTVVGGWLRQFAHKWKSHLCVPSSMLRILLGYKIPLTGTPPLSIPSAALYTTLSNAEHIRVVNEEVEALLAKGAVEEVSPSLGYYSKMFVVTKKDGGWRPIINLKFFNKTYMVPPRFRRDTPRDVAALIRPGDWAASIDLKDAYFHVPVHHRFHRLLYQYRVLPFGLCLAPWIFTVLTMLLKKWLRARGSSSTLTTSWAGRKWSVRLTSRWRWGSSRRWASSSTGSSPISSLLSVSCFSVSAGIRRGRLFPSTTTNVSKSLARHRRSFARRQSSAETSRYSWVI